MDMLIKMANYYQVSLDDLVERYNQAVDQPDVLYADLSYEGRYAVELFIEFIHWQEKNNNLTTQSK